MAADNPIRVDLYPCGAPEERIEHLLREIMRLLIALASEVEGITVEIVE